MKPPYYADEFVTLHHGDCLDVLRGLPGASVDAVVTDPPYGLEFMGKEWDKFDRTGPASFENLGEVLGGYGPDTTKGRSPLEDKPRFSTMGPRAMRAFGDWCELWAAECLRVLKPGGHLLAFGGTRTWHRLACAVEDAGFEVRDSIAWLYGSGFPKSLDVSKAIDKAAGVEREVVGRYVPPNGKAWNLEADESTPGYSGGLGLRSESLNVTAPATPDAERWQGWGTALKPAFEPVVVARKPLSGTVAGNVLAWGTGALNVDGCRIEGGFKSGWSESGSKASENDSMSGANYARDPRPDNPASRWPANVILDESQAEVLDGQSGESVARANRASDGRTQAAGNDTYGGGHLGVRDPDNSYTDAGGASRFMYVAKADASERPRVNGTAHPTVKPLALMRWLVRLVTPPGGTILEPFAGSGTTVEAALLEGFKVIAIEREAEYLPLIESRIARRRDPVRAVELAGGDAGLFDLLGEEPAG